MKIISSAELVTALAELINDTSRFLPPDVCAALTDARDREQGEPARTILSQIVENAAIAAEDRLPLCQDTGIAVFFVDMGEEVRVDGAGIGAAIGEATRRGYLDGALRTSIVRDPFRRANTGDNTPPIVHYRVVPGDRLRIWHCPKGGGCENMSRLVMLSPGEGREGAINFVVDTVRNGGGKPCPPVVVGVGIGGDFEYSAILAKRALLRKLGERNPDSYYAGMERELLTKINALGIGPMGLGGGTTALDVFVEAAPCHIASLPVAVNIQCHSNRHGYLEL